jgi:hypothetical protein
MNFPSFVDFSRMIISLGRNYYSPSSFVPLWGKSELRKALKNRRLFNAFFHYSSLNEAGFWMLEELKKNNLLCDFSSLRYEASKLMFSKLNKTLRVLREAFEQRNINWILVKTLRGYPRIPNDLDVLIFPGSFSRAKRLLLELGFKIIEEEEGSLLLTKKNLYKVHLHRELKWVDADFFSLENLIERKKKIKLGRVSVFVPCPNFEVLISLAHSNFENLYLSLGECLYLFRLGQEEAINWDYIFREATRYRWKKVVRRTLKELGRLHLYLYGEPYSGLPIQTENKPIRKEFEFPYHFSKKHLVLSSLEKGIWSYLFKKGKKVTSLFLGSKRGVDYIKSFELLLADGKNR